MDTSAGAARIAVIGVGNDFRHDDGAGWAVVAALAEEAGHQRLPEGTTLLVCDGEPGRLISLWEGAGLVVVIDSALADPGQPGRIHRLEWDGARIAGTGGSTSSHGLGLGDALELARALNRLPGRLIVYAVEGADTTLGTGLTAPVAAAVAALAERIADEIRHYGAAERGPVPSGGA